MVVDSLTAEAKMEEIQISFEKYFWPATPNNELRMSFTRLYMHVSAQITTPLRVQVG